MKASLKYFFLVLITAFSVGCGDDKDTSPTTGIVKGSITPANGASKVYLVSGTDTVSGTPTSSGTFELTSVKPGSYQFSIKSNEGFSSPAPTAVEVTAGQTTEVPAITLTQLPANGLMSVSVSGTAYSGTPTFAAFGNGLLFIYSNGYQVHLTLPAITGTGTYTTSSTSDLEFKVINNTTGAMWSSDNASGTGTLNITSYNATTKKGSGTFTFTATPGSGATGNKVGTNGSLQNVKLKN
jgi:hypothetical protein